MLKYSYIRVVNKKRAVNLNGGSSFFNPYYTINSFK